VALPTQSYHGITFSMPDVLWPLFRDNPTLAKALPALAAGLIQAKAATRHGLRVWVMAILHTFNGRLEFNSHVHTMSTAGGLHDSYEVWVRDILYDKDALMRSWRRAVIAILRAAAQARQLVTRIPSRELEQLLGQQENRWWSINIQSFQDKQHFLKYAGRYTRRPPIAEHRISLITERTVTFWYRSGVGSRLRRLYRREPDARNSNSSAPERARHLSQLECSRSRVLESRSRFRNLCELRGISSTKF
jgi:hypothetical protein